LERADPLGGDNERVSTNERLDAFALTAPLPVVAAVVGIPSAIVMALVFKIVDRSGWGETLIFSAGFGVLAAGAVVFGLRLRRRMLRAVVGDSSTADLVKASRAAISGPVPADPETRAAALAIASRQLASIVRFRIGFIVGAALILVSMVGRFATGDRWSVLWSVPVVLVLGAQFLYMPKRLRDRIRLLGNS
jgi:hypothetical protein